MAAGDAFEPQNGCSIELGYRPPYQRDRILGFLGMRAIPGVELVRDGSCWRTVRMCAPMQA